MKKSQIASLLIIVVPLFALPDVDAAETQASEEQAPLSPPESGNPLPVRDDKWRFTLAFPMIWAPDINGKIRGDEPVDFEVGFNDILDKLSFGLMFELYANRGPYGMALRSSYMRVEDERSRSGLIDTRIETGLDMGVSDLLASFRVHDKVRLVTGIRHIYAKLELDIFAQIGSQEVFVERVTVADQSDVDYLLGINFNHWFNDRWGIMLNADSRIAGDNDRDRSIEIRGLYRLGTLNNFWFGYRYLGIGNDFPGVDIDYSLDMTQAGPTLGWAFTF